MLAQVSFIVEPDGNVVVQGILRVDANSQLLLPDTTTQEGRGDPADDQ